MRMAKAVQTARMSGAVWLLACGMVAGQEAAPGPAAAPSAAAPQAPAERPLFVPLLVRQAEAVAAVVESDLARAFLAKAVELPEIEPRTILRDPASRDAFTEEQAAKLPEDQQARLRPREYGSSFYYTTGYGSPMIYARPLDILAKHGVDSLAGKRVLDFGYGMIGQERMFALMGADVHGVDVEPTLAALYSWPGDTGEMKSRQGNTGTLTLHHGRWPRG